MILFLAPVFSFPLAAQTIPVNRYGLHVITSRKLYRSTIQADSNQQMIPLEKIVPGIILDLRYATRNNFLHTVLYHHPIATLRLPAARALAQVQAALHTRGYAIKVWDAYRPYHVTEKMWQTVPDARYAADPRTGSGHNRGIAVDLTIVDARTGRELDMGTGFDNFTDSAHHDFQLPGNIAANRQLLKETMQQFGFQPLATEWWHYAFIEADRYPLMDLDFSLF